MTTPGRPDGRGPRGRSCVSVSRLLAGSGERLTKGIEPGLSDTQLAALAALEVHSAMTPGELAEHEKVQPPSMTRVIAALEGLGWSCGLRTPPTGVRSC